MAEKTSYVLEVIIKAVNQAGQTIAAVSDSLTKATKQTATNQDAYTQAVQKSKAAWEELGVSVNKVKTKMREINQLANQLTISSLRASVAGAAIFAAAYFPVKEAVDFQHALQQIKAVSGATEHELKAMSDAAKSMGFSSAFSATEAANALMVLAKAGFNATESLAALPAVMNLAVAGEMSVAAAADVASNAMHGFNLNALQLAHITDVIAYAAAQSTVDVKDVAESFKYVAAAAQSAGMSVDDVGAAIMVLGNAGIKASMAGTTLRSMIMSLTDATPESQRVLRGMGVQIFEVTGKMRPFIDILNDLSKAQMTTAQAGQLFTTRAASGVMALVNSVDDLNKFKDAQDQITGSAKRMADIMLEDVKGAFMKLQATLSGLFVVISDYVLTPLYAIARAITAIVGTFAEFVDAVPILKHLAGAILSVIAVLGAFLLVGGGAGLALAGLIRIVAALSKAIGYFGATALKTATGVTSLSTALGPLAKAFTYLGTQIGVAWTAMLNMGAMGWMVTAIIAVIVLTVTHLIYLAGAYKRAADAAIKHGNEAAKNSKALQPFIDSLDNAKDGTAEYTAIMNQLVEKYPELAVRINEATQSIDEQRQIVRDYKKELAKKEFEAAAEGIAAIVAQIRELDKAQGKLTTWQKIRMVAQTSDFISYDSHGESAKKALEGQSDAVRKIFAEQKAEIKSYEFELRKFTQTMIKATDFAAIDMQPIDLVKSSREELKKYFETTAEGQYILAKAKIPLEQYLDYIERITEKERVAAARRAAEMKALGYSSPNQKQAAAAIHALSLKITNDFSAMEKPLRDQVHKALVDIREDLSRLSPEQIYALETSLKKTFDALALLGNAGESIAARLIAAIRSVSKEYQDYNQSIGISPFPKLSAGIDTDQIPPELKAAIGGAKELNRALSEVTALGMPPKLLLGILEVKGGMQAVEEAFKKHPELIDEYAKKLQVPVTQMSLMENKLKAIALYWAELIKWTGSLGKAFEAASGIISPTTDLQKAVSGSGAAAINKISEDMKVPVTALSQKLQEVVKVNLEVTSSFRTLAQQYALYIEKGSKLVAKPGTSKHEVGLAIDVDIKPIERAARELGMDTDAFLATFGFVRPMLGQPLGGGKFAKNEPWHLQLRPDIFPNAKQAAKEAGVVGKAYDELMQKLASMGIGGTQFIKADEIARAKEGIKTVDTERKAAFDRGEVDRATKLKNDAAAAIAQNKLDVEAEKNALAKLDAEKASAEQILDQKRKIFAAEQEGIRLTQELSTAAKKLDNERAKEKAALDLKVVEEEIKLMEEAAKSHEAIVARDKAIVDAQYEARLVSGREWATKTINLENSVLQTQIDLNNKRIQAEQQKFDIRKLEITGPASNIPPDRREIELKTLLVDFEGKIKGWKEQNLALTWKQVEAEQKRAKEAAKFFREAQKQVEDLQFEGALGPVAKEAAEYQKMQRDNLEAQRKFNDELEIEITKKLSSKDITEKEIAAYLELERALKAGFGAAIRRKEEVLSPYLGKEAARWGEAVSQGISQIVDAFIDGGTDVRQAIYSFFRGILKEALVPGFKALTETLTQAFMKMFKTLGEKIQSPQLGSILGNAIMGLVAIVGMYLTSATQSGSFTASGASTGITQHEAVRGVIAGETSIPIAEIAESLEEALAPHLDVLRKIERNTREGGASGASSSSSMSQANINLIVEGLSDSLETWLHDFFDRYTMTGAQT